MCGGRRTEGVGELIRICKRSTAQEAESRHKTASRCTFYRQELMGKGGHAVQVVSIEQKNKMSKFGYILGNINRPIKTLHFNYFVFAFSSQ